MKYLLWIGAMFYAFEAVIHALGLPILEHDKIFLPTHDRYIAIMAFTYAVLLVFIATDLKKYRQLFIVTMAGILVSMINAVWIAHLGGYAKFFHTNALDKSLAGIGIGAVIWYVVTLMVFYRKK